MKDKTDILKIGLDLDGTISYCPTFFSLLTNALKDVVEIHIITDREQTSQSEEGTKKELEEFGIYYHHLIITDNKVDYILKEGITVHFDDTDEYFVTLPEKVKVFKMRETWNFDFENHVWLYSDKTGRSING